MQSDAEVEQDQGEPDNCHGERSVSVSGIEEAENRDAFVGIFRSLNIILKVLLQRDVIPLGDSLQQSFELVGLSSR